MTTYTLTAIVDPDGGPYPTYRLEDVLPWPEGIDWDFTPPATDWAEAPPPIVVFSVDPITGWLAKYGWSHKPLADYPELFTPHPDRPSVFRIADGVSLPEPI